MWGLHREDHNSWAKSKGMTRIYRRKIKDISSFQINNNNKKKCSTFYLSNKNTHLHITNKVAQNHQFGTPVLYLEQKELDSKSP